MRWRIVAVAVISIAVFGAPAAHASVIQLQPNNIGLVGYWSFNEGTSTIAHDFSGHGNSGTLSTTGSTLPQWVPGKFGTALSFDGSSSYIQASFSTLAPPVTMTAWIYPTTDSGIHAIISHDSNDNSGWRVGMIGSSLRFTLGGVADYSCGLNPTLNTWNFVAVVVSGNNGTRECYVNTSSSSGSIGTMSGSPNRVTIGTDYPGEVFQGKIDDVRIYNRALSATEVAGLYQSGAAKINSSQSPGTLSNGLVGWWTMDGADTVWSSATAGTEADRSGNGNTGTLNGMNRATSPVVGKIGQALNFTTGYITLPSSPVSNLAGPSSACAWVKDTNISAIPAGFAQTIFIFSDGLGNVLRMTDSETAVGESIDGGIIIGSTGGGEVITSSQQLFNNTWAFVCYTYSGSAWSIYVNGQSVATRGDSGIGLPTNNVIGARDTSGDGIWSGAIDDVRIYNRALSASEIQQLYNLGAGTHINTSSANLQSGSSLTSGLMGLWTFDGSDISGSTVYDLSGNGNNGTNNGTTPTIGKLGQALNFTTGYITLPSSPVSNLAGPSSACAWVKDTNISAIPAGFAQTIFIFSDGLGNVLRMTDSETAVGESIDGGIIIGSTGGGEVITSSQQLFNNTWAFVCYTYSGSAWSIYVNGQSVATRGDSGIGLPTNNVIGARDTSGDGIWSGAIDDVRIYNRALSASEVQQLYLMGK